MSCSNIGADYFRAISKLATFCTNKATTNVLAVTLALTCLTGIVPAVFGLIYCLKGRAKPIASAEGTPVGATAGRVSAAVTPATPAKFSMDPAFGSKSLRIRNVLGHEITVRFSGVLTYGELKKYILETNTFHIVAEDCRFLYAGALRRDEEVLLDGTIIHIPRVNETTAGASSLVAPVGPTAAPAAPIAAEFSMAPTFGDKEGIIRLISGARFPVRYRGDPSLGDLKRYISLHLSDFPGIPPIFNVFVLGRMVGEDAKLNGILRADPDDPIPYIYMFILPAEGNAALTQSF